MTSVSPPSAAVEAQSIPKQAPVAARARRVLDWISDVARLVFASALLYVLLLLALFGVNLRTAELLQHHADPFVIRILSVAVPALCALPAILTVCLQALVVRAINIHLRFHPLPHPAALGLTSDKAAEIAAEAEKQWKYEIAQVAQRGTRLAQQATLYGFFCSLALSASVVLASNQLFGTHEITKGSLWGAAIGSASLVAFVTDAGRMVVRSARRDASSQMFAWATKRFLIILTCTLMLVALAVAAGQDIKPETEARWALIGAAMAILGDRAAAIAGDRVASALGLPAPLRRDDQDLRVLEGIGDEEAARLAEEGVDSLHSLAFCSTPRLFLHTPYLLPRICDWQDQALLRLEVGEVRARQLREQLGVRRASQAQSLANEYLDGKLAAEQKADLAKLLGLASEAQATGFMRRLSEDETATLLALYRRSTPEPNTPEET